MKATNTSHCTELGLEYFRRRLDAGIMPGDGAFKKDTAITALVGMAFLSSGSTQSEGPDAPRVCQCIQLILKNTRKNGVLAQAGASEQGMVYAHGFATTFLAECLGTGDLDEQLRKVLEKAVEKIVHSQGPNGGWRYSFQPGEEDVSVTACFLTALRACRNAGIAVPAETIHRGIAFVLRCQNPDGGFRYRLTEGPSAYPRSAAAIAALCAAGNYNSPEIRNGLTYIQNQIRYSNENTPQNGYFFYAQYYAVQAFRLTDLSASPDHILLAGSAEDSGTEFIDKIIRELVQFQEADGSWSSSISVDHATALALITIQSESNYLPIFQK